MLSAKCDVSREKASLTVNAESFSSFNTKHRPLVTLFALNPAHALRYALCALPPQGAGLKLKTAGAPP